MGGVDFVEEKVTNELMTVNFHAYEGTEIEVKWLQVDTRRVATINVGESLTIFLGNDVVDGVKLATEFRDAISGFLNREGVQVE